MEKLLGKKTKRTNKGFFPEKLFNILNNKKKVINKNNFI